MTKLVSRSEIPSILSKTFQVIGDIKSSGVLEIEGKVKGTIKGVLVIIRENGIVDGFVESESLSIYGCFNGDIKSNIINVFQKAKVTGNIEYNTLSVENGASIDGKFKKINSINATNKIVDNVANENGINIKLNRLDT